MKKVKLIVLVIVTIMALVIVLQNTAVTRAQVLFWSAEMSLALLLILTFVLGFIVGVLVAGGLLRKRRKA